MDCLIDKSGKFRSVEMDVSKSKCHRFNLTRAQRNIELPKLKLWRLNCYFFIFDPKG